MWGRSWSSLALPWQLNGALMNPSQAGHSQAPDTISPLWPAALTLKRNPLGILSPSQTCPPKRTFCTVLWWRGLYFFLSCSGLVEPSQWWAVLYSQTKEETTITLGRWSALSGLKRLWWGEAGRRGRLYREVSVSWATTLIVCPCLKFPIAPHLLPFLFFFLPFIGCSKDSFLGKGDWFLHKSLVLEGSFLLTYLKNARPKRHLNTLWLFLSLCRHDPADGKSSIAVAPIQGKSWVDFRWWISVRICFVTQDSEVQCSAWDRGECTHLSSFGGTDRQNGGGESIWEEWEVPVLQSSGLGGIWNAFGVLPESLGKCEEAEILTID